MDALIVSRAEAGQKLLNFLSRRVDAGSSELHKWIRSGQVRVNGGRAKAFDRVGEGEVRDQPQPRGVFTREGRALARDAAEHLPAGEKRPEDGHGEHPRPHQARPEERGVFRRALDELPPVKRQEGEEKDGAEQTGNQQQHLQQAGHIFLFHNGFTPFATGVSVSRHTSNVNYFLSNYDKSILRYNM